MQLYDLFSRILFGNLLASIEKWGARGFFETLELGAVKFYLIRVETNLADPLTVLAFIFRGSLGD